MSKTRIDAHCHLFNKDILTIRIWMEIIHELEDLIIKTDKKKKESLKGRILNTIQTIRRIINFIKIGWSDSTTDIYKILQDDYVSSQNEKFIVTPLTLDIKYAFSEPGENFRNSLKKYNEEDELLRKEVKRLTDSLEQGVIALSDETREKYYGKSFHLFDKVENKVYHELLSEIETLLDTHAEFKTYTNKFLEAPDSIAKSKMVIKRESSYEIQIQEMLALSNNAEYGKYVIPFFSVDPRRADTPEKAVEYLNNIKSYVGKNKPFAGIKLYCPLGYSPTDPFLFGSEKGNETEDCLYKFCQENKIPITAHCSDAGFATFARYAKVTGHIFIKKDTTKEMLVYVENEMVDFGSTVLAAKDKKEAIRKRARVLNHPEIWTKVYEKYNDLYLNLAHFGGEDIVGDWRPVMDNILKIYPNAYTDFSCYSDAKRLKNVKTQYYDPDKAPKNKFLYGSDFYLVMLSETKFSTYTEAFNNIFSQEEYDDISINTPREFMKYVIEK